MSSTRLSDVCGPSMSSAGRLCANCSGLGHEIRQLCETKDYLISKPRASVERYRSTCAFCEMIASIPWLKSWDIEGDFIIHRKPDPDDYYGQPADGINQLTIARESGHHVKLTVFTPEGSVPATAKHVSGRCIKAASNLDRAKHWFNDCLRNHDHDQDRPSRRPSRLVAVGTADGSESIKIVDGLDRDKEYLAVSYRWGRETLLTTSETFELFHTSIPWEQLPKTFQDAINIARELGIEHMWIDSLCIIQDDLIDWEIESGKMANIYKSALLTIMAASASDSQGGFFPDRATIKKLVALPYTDASGTTELSVFVGRRPPNFRTFLSAAPLFQRGWVFQERLMSKRKLIFGETQTYWECDGVVLSESNIQSQGPFEIRQTQNDAAFQVFTGPIHKMNTTCDPISPVFLWRNVVSQYSPCALTYEADRLPALSGIARTFARRFGGSYAAGLWQDQMPYNLLWFASYQASKETYKGEYCAPSWSWASIRDGVHFDTPGGMLELEILSINIKLAGRDPYGRVCPGSSMCVRGRLRSGTLVRREGYEHEVWLYSEHGRLNNMGYLDRYDENLPLEVVYLEVSSGRVQTHRDATCLLLRRIGADKHFRRVGMANLQTVVLNEDYLFHGLGKEAITLV